jgi:sec-independent protein translocase protein TatA
MNPAFIQGIGPLELVIVLALVLLVLGPKRLPGLARSAGAGLRELRSSIAAKDEEEKRPDERPALEPVPERR